MEDLRTDVTALINKAVTLDTEKVNKVVDHLFSPDIGITSIDDLAEVDQTMLASTGIGAVPLKKLLRAFSNTGKSTNSLHNTSNGQADNAEETDAPEDSDDVNTSVRFREGDFRFTINWNDMPKKTVKALMAKKLSNEEGEQKDINDLKDALSKKIISKYDAFRLGHPGVSQKTPGVNVYRDVANQVVMKFEVAMQDAINGVVYGNGVATFAKKLCIKIENEYRNKPGSSSETGGAVMRGKGVPGVLPEQYHPELSKPERNRQVLLQKALQEMHKLDESERDWSEIIVKMSESYELQRDLVVKCTKSILKRGNALQDEESDEDEGTQEKLVEQIKNTWPFLFTLKAMCNHHKQLTGRDLEAKLNKFFDSDSFKFLIPFLSSCSNANLINALLNLKLQSQLPNMTNGAKLLVAVCMLANHFKESWSENLLFKAEQTTLPDEVEAVVPNLPSSICIIALGSIFTADCFYICVDKVCVAETSNAGSALLMLVQLCFILDLQYPDKMVLTFEFIERIILEMTPQETRVRNKGKILLVLSEKVKQVGKNFNDFAQQAIRNLQDVD